MTILNIFLTNHTIFVLLCCLIVTLSEKITSTEQYEKIQGPSLDKREVYLNGTAYIRLQTAISLRRHIGLSFRTCRGGELFSQSHDSNMIHTNIVLTVYDKRLQLIVTIGLKSYATVIDTIQTLLDNRWHTVELLFQADNLTMYLDNISLGIQKLVANNTYNSEILTNTDLYKEDAVLIVGKGFNGCLLEGPSLLFGTNVVSHNDAFFGLCPLSNEQCTMYSRQDMIATKQPKMADFCFGDPCMRHGQCIAHADRYECKCLARYSGKNCEVDQGPPCQRAGFVPCLNGATCIEDAQGDFACHCPVGFTGVRCENAIEVNPICENHPCRNNGTCIVKPNTTEYTCICAPGFTGVNCTINIDDCKSNPCQNNGRCIDGINNYTCDCSNTGYSGIHCDIDIDECQTKPCLNQGVCFNYYGTYVCQCRQGFYGRNCENMVNECALNPCKNNGRCIKNGNNGYKCVCASGWTGDNCEIKLMYPCNLSSNTGADCPPYADCVKIANNYQCICRTTGYTHSPDIIYNCTEMQFCKTNICRNAATCLVFGDTEVCDCLPGFTGRYCQIELNCNSNPCKNGGLCIDIGNSFNCTCPEQWMGPTCEISADICSVRTPCMNNGTCITDPHNPLKYSCKCPLGFTGNSCDINIDDCVTPGLCPSNRVCVDGINSYECRCPPGYGGDNCTIKVNSCDIPGVCVNGTCQQTKDGFECNCFKGFKGKNCNEDVNECELTPNLCKNGICLNNIGSFDCYCTPGFTGNLCEQDFNECLSHPCQNGATCINLVNNYECKCTPGYKGKDCHLEIDECASNPCADGSTCIDGIASFTCSCPPGLSGLLCDVDIDDCLSSPCQNNGKCIDGLNSYRCDCNNTGFIGEHCDENIDDCLSNPCTNGAICIDLVNNYTCSCYPGFSGKNCQYDIDECQPNPCNHDGICFQRSNQTLYDRYFQKTLNFTLPEIFYNNFNYSNAAGYECHCKEGISGKDCEKNINECESNPCLNGQCSDHVGYYTCECDDGFEGKQCETNINECLKYTPCVHGTCIDRRADYYCDCIPGYGGKNCSVELTGCLQEGACANNGTCKPYLENEIYHKFNCSCTYGFHGATCENVTTMSLDGKSYILVNTTREEGYDIQFRFKTTLANGLLAIGKGVTFYILELVNGRLNLHSSLLNKWEGVFIGSNLNDGKWQKVFVAINASHLVLSANEEQTIYPINLNEGSNASHTSFPTTYLGGTIRNLRQLTHGPPSFVGCAEDVVINGEWVLPETNQSTSGGQVELKNIQVGCPREPQCQPNPCHSGGHCTDLWRTFNCSCERPYIGHTCQYNYTAATFGHENITNSLVTVSVTESARRAVRSVVHISMFIRTRQNKGQIFCLGSAITAVNLMEKTYIAAELEGGELLVRIQFNSTPESYTVGGVKLDNGYNHLIEVSRNVTLVQVKLNGTEYFRKTISATGQLDVQTLYLGGLPQISRPVRQADLGLVQQINQVQVTNAQHRAELNLAVANFKGIIQDVQISNGTRTMIVEFFPLKVPDLEVPMSFGQVSYENGSILEGIVSDDMCRSNPCQNNGTCYNTWNDFNCNCTIGYKGKICNEMEFCQLQDCPDGSICKNLNNGYECIANATLDRHKPPLIYNFINTSNKSMIIDKMEINYRSNRGGTIFYVLNNNHYFIVSVNKDQIFIQWKLNDYDEQYTFHKGAPDGQWTTILFTFKDNSIQGGFKDFIIDDSPKFVGQHFQMDTFIQLITSTSIIIGGGYSVYDHDHLIEPIRDVYLNKTATTYIVAYATTENILITNNVDIPNEDNFYSFEFGDNFKGCIGEIRLGEYLLPLFTVEELNSSNINLDQHFELNHSLDSIGCILCFNSDCSNGGKCLNATTDYICECPAGFEADDCSININECIDNRCENNSTCIDGIANYTCQCQIGWNGWLCDNDIDECLSDPCHNGATCVDHLGYFQCICLQGYSGTQCEIPPLITCSDYPCKNNSKCIDEKNKLSGNNFTCECATGFVGEYCDLPYCQEAPCKHGNCTIIENTAPTCTCVRGYTGKFCEIDIDDCVLASGESPCQHNGRCIDGIDKYQCDCSGTGYKGLLCEHDIDECQQYADLKLCSDIGECINFDGGYRCNCQPGYCGRKCVLRDPCYTLSNRSMDDDFVPEYNNLCGNNGECIETCDLEPSYQCKCFDGYEGDNCTSIEESLEHSTTSMDVAIIVIPIVVILLLLAAAGLAILLAMARNKRATRGTYSPSAQEFCNPRVEMDHVLKPPPEERLI